ncbi:MAG: DoxX family protein [Myxococcota bacterium]
MSRLNTALSRAAPYGYLALRVVAGLLFACHGMQKLFGIWTTQPMPAVGTEIWFAGLIELVCGLLVAVGLFTRIAAFLASGEMAVAYFQGHFKGDFADWHWVPVVNQGELAVLYCFIFLAFALGGAGIFALDGLFHRRAGPRPPDPEPRR